tara:strand:+ start:75 stop:428 length:354 start_codon:yes stop_codon:yes gene_type:complete
MIEQKQIRVRDNNTAKGWINSGAGFDALTFIGESYFDNAGETGTTYYLLPQYQEHATIKDNEGYPMALELGDGDNPLWAQRFLTALTSGRPQGEAYIIGQNLVGDWIVAMTFDRRRG